MKLTRETTEALAAVNEAKARLAELTTPATLTELESSLATKVQALRSAGPAEAAALGAEVAGLERAIAAVSPSRARSNEIADALHRVKSAQGNLAHTASAQHKAQTAADFTRAQQALDALFTSLDAIAQARTELAGMAGIAVTDDAEVRARALANEIATVLGVRRRPVTKGVAA